VERYHFTDDIEHLRRDSTRSLGQNIAYVLNRFPNHHRALRSMTLLVQRTGSERPEGMDRSLDCWFSRARQFQPDDGVVPMIYGMHYYSQGEYDKAVEKMQEGLEIEPDNRNIHYNIALAYMELERYEKAREHAREAYERNFPLDGLRRKLQAAGEWE
jgi:tetratricopeptide (TPR) repeat protein